MRYNVRFWGGAACVALGWVVLIALLVGLQSTGQGFGFNVWWIGETRNWLSFLQDGVGSEVAQTFWKVDSRNPLSPWWYIPFRSFILTTPSAFLVLHLFTSLLLGLASYAVIMSITDGRARSFAISLGAVSAVFLCSSKFDGIHWNFVGALAFSLLCVWCFSEYLRSGRQRQVWLMWSLVAWLVAVQSYTIQTGAALAVGVLSFLEFGWPHSLRDVLKRLGRGITDMLPYFVALFLFVLIWRTTAATGITDAVANPTLSLIGQSLLQGIWHNDYSFYWALVQQLDPRLVVGVIVIITTLFIIAISYVDRAKVDDAIGTPDLLRVLLVGICLVVPTIVIEVTSVWFPPGSRWVMLLQFWTPLMLLSVVAVLFAIWPSRRRWRVWTWRGVTGLTVSGAVLLTLAYNQLQVRVSQVEQLFISELRKIALEDKQTGAEFPRHYLILVAPGAGTPSDWVSRAYTKTSMSDVGEVTYRHVLPTPVPAGYEIAFGPDAVRNPEFSRNGSAPYSRVAVLSWDGIKMTRVPNPDRSIFEGRTVLWERAAPLP